MLPIYKKELKSYFCSVTGYAVIAVFLLFSGIFTSIYSFFYMSPSVEATYSSTVFVLLAIVPVMSMRALTEEKRNKTDVLLDSLPMRTSSYVLGKYFAELTLIAVCLLIAFSYSVILSFYGKVNFLSAISGTVGYFFCASAMLAIGLFISSLFDNTAASAAVTFAVLLLSYFVPSIVLMLPTGSLTNFAVLTVLAILLSIGIGYIASSKTAAFVSMILLTVTLLILLCFFPSVLDGSAVRLMGFFSLTERFESFSTYGVFDISAIVYYVSVSVFFTFLAFRSMEWRLKR